jgi:hypothetical protein
LRVSEVCKQQFTQAGFVTWDTDAATQSRTGHSCDRQVLFKMKQLFIVIGLILVTNYRYTQSGFDFIDGQTSYFKDSTSARTNLINLKFIGQLSTKSSSSSFEK